MAREIKKSRFSTAKKIMTASGQLFYGVGEVFSIIHVLKEEDSASGASLSGSASGSASGASLSASASASASAVSASVSLSEASDSPSASGPSASASISNSESASVSSSASISPSASASPSASVSPSASASESADAPSFTGSDAGTTAANGDYVEDGTYNGVMSYKKADNSAYVWRGAGVHGDPTWMVHSTKGTVYTSCWYINASSAVTPPLDGPPWSVSAGASPGVSMTSP